MGVPDGKEVSFSVVALCSFKPGDVFEFVSEEQATTAPHFSSQLSFTKGEVFEVLDKEPQWWLFVQSSKTEEKGYIPSSLTAPVNKAFLTPANIKAIEKGQRLIPDNIDHNIDLQFFPKAPVASNMRKPSPEDSASWFSRVTFWWLNGLVMTGYKRPLVDSDLFQLIKNSKSEELMPAMIGEWEKEKKRHRDIEDDQGDVTVTSGSRPSVVAALRGVFLKQFLFASLLKLIHDLIMFVQPKLLQELILFIGDELPDSPHWYGYALACAMFGVGFFQNFFQQQYFMQVFKLGIKIRTSLLGIIYRKAFKLSNDSRSTSTVGEMVNLMSVDTQRLNDMITYINMVWSGPLQISLALYFLFETMGPSILAGTAVLVLLIPFNLVISHVLKKMQSKLMACNDERIKIVNEVLNGVKVIKLYAWESSFMKKIGEIRGKGLRQLKNIAYVNSVTSFTWTTSPFLVSLATFTTYVLIGNELTAAKAFVAISLFNILRFPVSVVPMIISQYIQARVSVNRINNFLNLTELDSDNVSSSGMSKHECLKIENGKFSWGKKEKEVLQDINLNITEGSLVAVVGQVGSGKSSILSALLGEMEKLSGSVHVQGSVAYVPQQAWIQNSTLRENILFGKGLDPKRYCKVISCCALATDLDILPGSDMTEIGEKGINLSGGQKQRVSLARSVYHNTDIYLLDDPLSAVDSHVGKHIFDNVIGPNGLLRKKTRVLVTHGISFLPEVDQIVVLSEGRISEVGTYQELLNNQGAFSEFLKNYAAEDDIREEDAPSEEVDVDPQSSRITLERLESRISATGSIVSLDDLDPAEYRNSDSYSKVRTTSLSSTSTDTKCKKILQNKGENKMIEEETSKQGNVSIAVFLVYMKAVGLPISLICIFCSMCSEASIIGARFWLAHWSVTNVTSDAQRDMFLGVYASLGFSQGFVIMIFCFLLAYGSIRASKNLHNNLLLNILRSPMSFFETTPVGRIVNRFSKDIFNVDETIPRSMRAFLSTFFSVCGTIIIISYSIPLFLVMVVPLGAMYFFTQRFYVATSRQLKRLESVSRSPIYNHFFESISGTSTIRAFQQEDRFIRENGLKVDGNQQAYYPSIVANRWLAFRLEFVGNCVVLFAVLFAVVGKDTLDKGLVGLAVTYAISVTATLNWMVRMTSEIETNIVAVERIKEYCETPTEAEWSIESKRPSDSWPQEGKVEFDKYSTRYRPGLDLVVKSISSVIKGGEKVGIVGRTGAGKSSLTLALFRIIERAEGSIFIDGVDIADIGLHDLRMKLTIIPQDPVLFSGTLRFNLDPFDKYDDQELWTILEVAHLKQFASSLPDGLDHVIAEGGGNISVGQRQLVCLGRALLRKTKILILDEATAAVDLETDELIQQTIRKVFADCTILTIAHRLNTVMDYDKIMVLDNGSIAEFDSPQNLINAGGIFHGMVKDAGIIQ